MKFGIRGFALLAVLVVIIYSLFIEVVLPSIAGSQINLAVQSACASCKFEIGSVSFGFFKPSEILIRNVRLKQGYLGSSELLIRIDSILIDVDLATSTSKQVSIAKIRVYEPDVLLVDGDANSPQSDVASAASDLTFVVASTELTDGQFTYTRVTKGTTATLHVAKIQGEFSPFGTSSDLQDRFVDVHLKAQIEKSGETELDLRIPMQSAADHVDVSVYLKDQDLAVTTPFFKPNAGVELQGKIVKARGRARVRDQVLTASAWVIYQGLSIKLNPMYDRTKLAAFFMNLGADLAMKEEDLDLDKADQTEFLKIRREPNERIVGFILRGLKEAAIKVARKVPSGPRTATR